MAAALSIAVLVALFLSGCGGGDPEQPETKPLEVVR